MISRRTIATSIIGAVIGISGCKKIRSSETGYGHLAVINRTEQSIELKITVSDKEGDRLYEENQPEFVVREVVSGKNNQKFHTRVELMGENEVFEQTISLECVGKKTLSGEELKDILFIELLEDNRVEFSHSGCE